jgi:opacity protein-like surface antigen
MKKHFLMITLCAILLSVSAVSYSSESEGFSGNYFTGYIGSASLKDSDLNSPELNGVTLNLSYDAGMTFGAAIGYQDDALRVEMELSHQKNDVNGISGPGGSLGMSGDMSIVSLLANGYYDIINDTPITPFLSAGIGFSSVERSAFVVNNTDIQNADDTVFAYQIGGGVGYEINETVTIFAKYRYFGTADVDFNGESFSIASHNFMFGARVNF